jgi:hypothetical protein
MNRWYWKHKDEPGFLESLRAGRSASRFNQIKNGPEYIIRERAKQNSYLASRSKLNTAWHREWKKNNPEKYKAHQLVAYAISTGKLKRPEGCSRCGTIPPLTQDGRSGLHAHHEDHSKPMEVEFLCYSCHGKENRKYL